MSAKTLPTKSPQSKVRLSTGSLQGLSEDQLDALKAELEAKWLKDNRASTGRPGRPSARDLVVAACVRIHRKMRRRKKATLNDWYEAVKENAQAQTMTTLAGGRPRSRTRDPLSAPTIKKYTREWLNAHIPFADLPEGIGPYCITTRKDFEGVNWFLVWTALVRQFSEVGPWLKNAKSPSGAFPGEMPHEILPRALQDTISRRLQFPFSPRRYAGLYDHLIRETLRHPQIRMEYGHRYPIVLRAFLGSRTEK